METLQPGQMLGPYRIINKIGQGGMASVYKAYQASMDRNVAVKVLPGQLAETEEFAKRFQQEARTIARLEHPHILPVIDFGEDNGITYFVMRYLEGGTLKSKMEAGPLKLDEVDRVFSQLCNALGYAHAHGVVHRDLKPANALVDESGNLFLTDFGIAKILESASPRLTQTDAIMGTPAYISPEQAQAQAVDQRSDIYSLGIILFEMVTGRVPFVADTPLAVILKHLSDPLPLPSVINADIPASIEQVILKALAKNREDRFASTVEFLSAWKRALHEMETVRQEPVSVPVASQAMPSTPLARQPQPPPPSKPVSSVAPAAKPAPISTGIWVGCGIVACIVLSVAGFFFFNGTMRPAAPTATVAPTQTLRPTATTTATLVPPTATVTPEPTTTETLAAFFADVLFEDDFETHSIWGVGTDAESAVEYVDDALNFIIYKSNFYVWSTPDYDFYEDIHIEVTVYNYNSDPNTKFGIICNQQSDDSGAFNYFVITPAGDYAIVRSVTGETDFFLTNNDDWDYSSLIPENASSYRLGADCGSDGALTLYVDGEEIDSVVDDTYAIGGVGLFVWSAVDVVTANISFDDFLLADLP